MSILKVKPIVSRERIFRKLHIAEGTEAFKNAYRVFDELSQTILNVMNLTAVCNVVDSAKLSFNVPCNFEKYVICFISSDDHISEMSNEMMAAGDYMKGYLLHEIAADVIFATSSEMNGAIREEAAKSGYKLSKRYAPGDGIIDLSVQNILLDILKREAEIKAYLNEEQVLFPEKSLLYMFGLIRGFMDGEEDPGSCGACENLSCRYRECNETI